MYGARKPDSFFFEKGKDTPMEGLSLASKTVREPSRLNRSKSYFPAWPGQKKKQLEQEESMRRLNQELEEKQRRLDDQNARIARIEAQQQQSERERSQREAEERELRRVERENAERQLEMEMQAEYDRRRLLEQGHRTSTPDALRNLRELIRTRYELDMEIYRMRHVRGPDRPLVLQKMQRADALLAEILAIVNTWEQNPETWDKREWELAVDIRNRLLADNKRKWANNPPWNDD
jgi:hypothetical protein